MEKAIDFPTFARALEDAGAEVPTREALKDPATFWSELPPDVRRDALARLGLAADDVDALEVTIGRRPDAPRTIDNVLVVLQAEGDGLRAVVAEESAADAEAEAAEDPAPVAAETAPPGDDPDAGDDAEDAEDASTGDADDAGGADGESGGLTDAEAEALAPPPEPPESGGLLSRLRGRGDDGAEAEEDAEDAEDDRPITEITPPDDPNLEVTEVYDVNDPYAFVRILYDKGEHEYVYEVIEPELTEWEQKVLRFLEDTLVDVIEVGLSAITPEEAEKMLREQTDQVIYDYSITLTSRSKKKLLYYILRDFLGEGLIDAIMRDEAIEDVSCDGPNIPIFLYHRKYESVRSTVMWKSHDTLDSFVIRMAQRSGKHISIAEPLLDATLPDGSRLNATLSDEVTAKGSTFTIRKFKEDPFTPPDLVRFGTMSSELLAYWWMAVQNGASAIYAGGTASGKTTSLNAILLFIPWQMKIVSIEDTREVNLPHPNWIPGITRSGFGPRDAHGRQAGEIDMFTLLKAALRQRPEYILVGEVRGEEAYALFQAMATGHTAYGTMHADSAEAVIHRLETEPINLPRSLLEALDIVSIQIQTRIGDKRVRRTKELVEIVGLDPHTREILTNQVFKWKPTTDSFEYSGVSYVLERVRMERNLDEHEMQQELERRKRIIEWMVKKGLDDYTKVGRIVAAYYKDPTSVMEKVKREMEELSGAH